MHIVTWQVMSVSKRWWTYQAKGKGKDWKTENAFTLSKGGSCYVANQLLPSRI